MKKFFITHVLLLIIFCSSVSAQSYFTGGVNLDFTFNCNKEVRDEIGVLILKPSIFLEYNTFKKNSKIGFHIDGNGCAFYNDGDLMLGLGAMIGPSFLFPTGAESGFIISPGITAGFLLTGDSEDENSKSNEQKDTTLGVAYLGIGTTIKYFFRSGLTIGLNLNYSPLTYISNSVTRRNNTEIFNKLENSISIGICFGFTECFK